VNTRLLIGEGQNSAIGTFIGTQVINAYRMNSNEVPLDAWNQCTLCGHSPVFDVAIEEISIFLDKLRRFLVSSLTRKHGGAYQRGNARS
jgi:hypothetical protein